MKEASLLQTIAKMTFLKLQVRTNLKDTSKVLDEQKKILFQAMLEMQKLAVMKAPADLGQLRQSIDLNPKISGATKYLLTAGTDYASHVEFGTSPHAVPIDALKGWAKRKLGDENLAYPVAAKIKREGTPMQPFMRPAFEEVKNVWLPGRLK